MRPAMSAYRKKIFEILQSSGCPLDARALRDRLNQEPNLSTVYRALEYLLSQNLVKSVSFFDQHRFYYVCHQDHCHFLYCVGCHEVREFHRCAASTLEKQLSLESGYEIQDHFLYFTGLCRRCQGENSQDQKGDES